MMDIAIKIKDALTVCYGGHKLGLVWGQGRLPLVNNDSSMICRFASCTKQGRGSSKRIRKREEASKLRIVSF
jgi:hypothetical protein